MAFTGSATRKKIADNLFRITGLSLGAGANGTIGLENVAAEVQVEDTGWDRYDTDGRYSGQVELDESVQVTVNMASNGASTESIGIVKSGDGPTDFLVTIHNLDGSNATGALEIYLRFH